MKIVRPVSAALLAAVLLLAASGFSGSGQTPLPSAEPTFVGPVNGVEADSASQEPGAVRVSWTPAENAQVHFVVYVESEDVAAGNYSRAQMVPFTGSEGVVTGLDGGTPYNFIVIGMRWNFVQFGTVWGGWSDWASATPAGDPQSQPDVPSSSVEPASVGSVTNLAVRPDDHEPGSVRVTWTEASNAQVHFVVYVESEDYRAGDFSGIRMAPFRGAEGLVSGLEAGKSYDFIAIGMRWNFVDFETVWGGWSQWVSGIPSEGTTIPVTPTNQRYQWSGSVINLSWDGVAGAVDYEIFHSNSFSSGCRIAGNGELLSCELLARGVSATSYTHTNPDPDRNYYWVAACNSVGCSEIDSANPAQQIDATPEPGPETLAPTDEPAFHRVVVGNRLNAGTYYLDFRSAGRFVESGRYPGGYSYSNTGQNTGTLTLDYDSDVYGGSCTVLLTFDSVSNGTWSYTCASGIRDQGTWTILLIGLAFVEGENTSRLIPENTAGGINVGRPVTATGGKDALTYSMDGPDADSFVILPDTGQIRTRSGVNYDYETRNRYQVTVMVSDGTGRTDSIDVTIEIGNLSPGCERLENLRANRGDGRLTVRWNIAGETPRMAGVLGYQAEIRRGSGTWTDRRTLLGRSVGTTVFEDLDNGIEYQVRVSAITTEGDCAWSETVSGTPNSDIAPDDSQEMIDRFGRQPVGAPDHNFRLLTPERCRHTVGGATRDATCRYENTGPDTGRIFLEFDDPALASCEVTLAYSSLTAGSFVDECFDAGVNTGVPFDRSFMMPATMGPAGGGSDSQQTTTDPQRAPRNQDEFVSLVHGRDDFIPGLSFGIVCRYCASGNVDFGPGWASRTEYDTERRAIREFPGTYSYQSAGPSKNGGAIHVFDLEFEASGNVRATITDPDGNVVNWPGMLHATLELGAQPILLPVPPSWSAAIAIETDFAPADYLGFRRQLRSLNPDNDSDIVWQTLFGEQLMAAVDEVARYGNSSRYEKIGHNRARVTVTFDDRHDGIGAYDEQSWSSDEQLFVDSEWVFDLTFTGDDTLTFTATRLRDGAPPITLSRGTIDLRGGAVNLNEFPEETVLPANSPQASGADRSGMEIAAAIGVESIGGDDIQTFLVSSSALQAAAFQPGDWLEPKDGGHQRMMIVGAASATRASPSQRSESSRLLPEINKDGVMFAVPISWTVDPQSASCVPQGFQATDNVITQLSVVCMQIDRGIPTRGARFFSEPKAAEGPVQLCQRNCVLNSTSDIQECVWRCERNSTGGGGTVNPGQGGAPSSTLSPPANARYIWNNGRVVLSWDPVEGADYYRIYHDDFFDSACRLSHDGSPAFCDLLADGVSDTTYTHSNPDPRENHYWVVACDSAGCSDIDSDHPAEYIDTRPASPANARYEWDGSVIRVSWDPAEGADYYRVYYDDFFDESCRLDFNGNPAFCELLGDNVSGTSYTHSDPDAEENHYWVVACNSGGCSDIDGRNPAARIE